MTASILFQQQDLLHTLDGLSNEDLDTLPFGVIGFDAESVVRRYNAEESRKSGLERERVLGHDLFTVVAQCMNNFLVAQRYQDAHAAGEPLDDTLDYVLTWRMRPVKVRLRMLSDPGLELRYVVLDRR